jgi:hypothetical protein
MESLPDRLPGCARGDGRGTLLRDPLAILKSFAY